MSTYPKPLPAVDADSRSFWEGCRAHRLMLQRCGDCGRCRFPSAPFCPHCQSISASWIEASGRASVFSWIVVRHPVPKDIYAGDVPYVVALIELAEGVRMASNIVGCRPEDVTAGMALEVVYDAVTPEITLPKFRPLGTADR
jgi:uncharacterized OB-fold protein